MDEPVLSYQQAYLAMIEFIQDFWIRDGKADDGIIRLVSFTATIPGTDQPSDPAMWTHWLKAIEKQTGN